MKTANMKTANRTEILRVRLTPAESEQVNRAAETADMSVSNLLRHRVLGMRIESTCDIRMLMELRRIGGLIKLMHQGGQHAEAARIASGLDAIRREIEAARTQEG